MTASKKKYRKSKQFIVIAYFSPTDGKKWKCNNLDKFTSFLDKSHSSWRWYEVYKNSTKQFLKRVLNQNQPQRKYTIIVKIGHEDFKKWESDDLLNFTSFLDKNFMNWRYYNVYCSSTKNQLSNFTQANRPTTATI